VLPLRTATWETPTSSIGRSMGMQSLVAAQFDEVK
jgi:hypothetical protein